MTKKVAIDIIARDKTKQAITSSQKGLQRLRKSVFSLRTAFIGLGGALVLRSIFRAGVQIQGLEVQLNALLGSAQEGQKALDTLTKFAAGTPFELSQIQKGVTALATVKQRAEEAGVSFEELLTITGNTAVILGGDFELASLQIQRAFSAGIASADTFRDRGVSAMAGFQTGVRTSTDETIKKLKQAFGRNGEFGSLMGDLANTVQGGVSNLQDALFILQANIASGFFDELESQLGDLQSFVRDNEAELAEFGKQAGQVLGDAIIVLGKAFKFLNDNLKETEMFLGAMLILFGGVSGKIAGTVLAVDGIRRAIKEYKDGVDKADDETQDFTKNLKKVGNETKDTGVTIKITNSILSDLVKNLEKSRKTVKELPQAFESLTESYKIGSISLKEYNEGLEQLAKLGSKDAKFALRTFKNILMGDVTKAINSAEGATKGLSEALARSIVLGEDFGDAMQKIGQQVLIGFVSALINAVLQVLIINPLIKFLQEQMDKLGNETKEAGDAMSSFAGKIALASASQALFGQQTANTNRQLQKQMALQSAVSAFGGLGGGLLGGVIGGIGKILGFADGGRPPIGRPSIVGERGAELFVPDSAGTVVPNEALGGTTNINFNITTVDAQGFGTLLDSKRGQIINMVNTALNSKGRSALV